MKKILATVFIFALLCGDASADMLGTLRGKYDLDIACGDFLSVAIPLSAAIYSAAIGDWEGELQLAQSCAATIALTQGLKYAVNAERPNGGRRSFPSGHSSSAFMGAAYWQMRYGWEFGVPMYAAAALVCYTRVDAEAHYWRDVIAGAAIGIGFNYLFTSRFENDKMQMSLIPMRNGASLNFSIRF